jgi:hypothetical protein
MKMELWMLIAHTDVQVEQSDETIEETIFEFDETEEVVIEASENEENGAATTACDDLVIESDDLDIEREKVETTEVVEKGNTVVVVHATATFENCPDSELYLWRHLGDDTWTRGNETPFIFWVFYTTHLF